MRSNYVKPVYRTVTPTGIAIIPAQRKMIVEMLESGNYPSVATIARACKTTPATVYNMLKKDPELKARWQNALAVQADLLAESAIDFCNDNEINPIAREKMIEFMLPRLDRERFGEQNEIDDAMRSATKRIVCVPVMPVAEVDANGIPLKKDPIEVKATVSPSPIADA